MWNALISTPSNDQINQKVSKKKVAPIRDPSSRLGSRKKAKEPVVSKVKKPTESKRKSMAIIQSLGNSHKLSPQAISAKHNKNDGTSSGLKTRQAAAAATALTKKRPRSIAKSPPGPKAALVQPTTTKSCRKKQKQHDVGIDIGPAPSNTTTIVHHCLESNSQIIQPKRDASGFLLCIHNRRTFNCPKCAHKHSFVNFKPQTSNDALDGDE
jgi:hypothetical protein